MKEKKARVQESDLDSVVEGLEKYVSTPTTHQFLHTGNLALDYAISMKADGSGGYPFGSIIELFGEPSAGKSLLLAKAIAEAQKRGMLAVVMDAEGRWDDDFATLQGVDIGKRKLLQPNTVEEFAVDAHRIFSNIKDKSGIIMVLDSVAILSTLAETKDVEEGDLKMDQGRKAQKVKQALRVLKSEIRNSNSILLAANHVISNPGSFTHQKVTPGGGGFPFQSSVRIELLNPTPIKIEGKNRPIGVQLHAKIPKNSVAPPFGVANISLYWVKGVDKYSGLLDIFKDQEVVTLSGAWYTWGDKKFQSKDFPAFVENNPEILNDPKLKVPYFIED